MMNQNGKWAIEPLVPEAIYTDRKEFIDSFHRAALRAASRRTISTVLLGQRRMGKTEIFKRVVNRLFFEQDHLDPNAVIPVYYQFPEAPIDLMNFALEYIENFIRWYAAFRLRDPEILGEPENCRELFEIVREKMDVTGKFNHAMNLWRAIDKGGIVLPEKKAIMLPRVVAARDDDTIIMFLDEFQNTRLPHREFDVTGYYQEAVESLTCPHFVTGSAMSMLADEMLGRGALYGRFDYERINAFTDYWGAELARRAAGLFEVDLPEFMAPVVSERCGGNPFYITAVVRQAEKQGKKIPSEEALNKLLAVDITSGFIWGELSEQVSRWVARVNEYGITKWVLHLAALEEGEEIHLERIQKELYRHEHVDVPIQQIKDVLVKLARGDLVDYKSFGDWFSKINDPILNEFLRVWGKIEVEKESRDRIEDQTLEKFEKIQKRFHEYKGYLAEVYMIQILWNGQGKTLPGRCFHAHEDIALPDRFTYIDQRRRPGAGRNMEVDIYAAAGTVVWMAESKWWSGSKVGRDVVENLLDQAKRLEEKKGDGLRSLRLWIFANDGFTTPAKELMRQNGVLWSARTELNELLEVVKLRKLPNLENNKNSES